MDPDAPSTPCAVLVFARTPQPGRVKRRLIPALGPAGAARLHERMVARAVRTGVEAAVGPVTVWATPTTHHPLFDALAAAHPVRLRAQTGADLGARMRHALEAALVQVPAALLVGSDCPSMTVADLRDAAAALHGGSEAVLGPAADGGYWLLGLRRCLPALFEEVPWGDAAVAEVTRTRLRAQGVRWRELELRPDVDRPEDLAAVEAELLLADPPHGKGM